MTTKYAKIVIIVTLTDGNIIKKYSAQIETIPRTIHPAVRFVLHVFAMNKVFFFKFAKCGTIACNVGYLL